LTNPSLLLLLLLLPFISTCRSGKLQVLVKVLAAWHKEGHKVLLFTQTQQMLDILEKHVAAEGYSYHRMDGNTPIAQRGRLMDDFNSNSDRCL
jgi:DNA excision repair protein ERCC-6